VTVISREADNIITANACRLKEVRIGTGVYEYRSQRPDLRHAMFGHGMVMWTVRLRQDGASLLTKLATEANNTPYSGANTENCGLYLHSLLEKEEAERGVCERQ
jgi:hypothetical protein